MNSDMTVVRLCQIWLGGHLVYSISGFSNLTNVHRVINLIVFRKKFVKIWRIIVTLERLRRFVRKGRAAILDMQIRWYSNLAGVISNYSTFFEKIGW